MRYLLLSLLLAFPATAHAVEGGSTTLFIGEEVCKWATEHVPDDDVAYQEGVDVEGKPVAPASMADQHNQELAERMLRQMTLEITSDLAFQLGIPDKLVTQRLTVGTIEIDAFGRPTVNGELLVNPDARSWQAACDQSKSRN